MPHPVSPGNDFKTWTDGLEPVTLTSVDPDTGATLAASEGVVALRTPQGGDEQAAGDGGVGYDVLSWSFAAADVAFAVKKRDTVTDGDGVVWIVGNVSLEEFEELYICRDCVKARG